MLLINLSEVPTCLVLSLILYNWIHPRSGKLVCLTFDRLEIILNGSVIEFEYLMMR